MSDFNFANPDGSYSSPQQKQSQPQQSGNQYQSQQWQQPVQQYPQQQNYGNVYQSPHPQQVNYQSGMYQSPQPQQVNYQSGMYQQPNPGQQPIYVNVQPPQVQPSPSVVKTFDKRLFVWLYTFLLGVFGVDRFLRGQVGIGVLKVLVSINAIFFGLIFIGTLSSFMETMSTDVGDVIALIGPRNTHYVSGSLLVGSFIAYLLSSIWIIVDFVVALKKAYGKAFGNEKNFTFINGLYAR